MKRVAMKLITVVRKTVGGRGMMKKKAGEADHAESFCTSIIPYCFKLANRGSRGVRVIISGNRGVRYLGSGAASTPGL